MKIYARIQDGVVREIILPWADENGPQDIPIEERFHPDFVATLVEITGMDPMPAERWTYDGQTFTPEAIPEPTPGDILAINMRSKDYYLDLAQRAMAPVLVSLQLGDATDQETLLAKAWQAYYRELLLVDLTVAQPAWPDPPQQ